MIVILLIAVFTTVVLTFIYSKILKKSDRKEFDQESYKNKIKTFALTLFILITVLMFVGNYLIIPSLLK
ncbi:hypothetical protein D5266_05940 [bacterium c-19]|nr:hypothetical protein [bacterium c-19]